MRIKNVEKSDCEKVVRITDDINTLSVKTFFEEDGQIQGRFLFLNGNYIENNNNLITEQQLFVKEAFNFYEELNNITEESKNRANNYKEYTEEFLNTTIIG